MFRHPPNSPPFPSTTFSRSRVTNAAGSVTSAPALLTVLQYPTFTVQPIGRSVPAGLPTTFSASVSGTTPITDRKSTRLNSSHLVISYAVFCLKKKITSQRTVQRHQQLRARGDLRLPPRQPSGHHHHGLRHRTPAERPDLAAAVNARHPARGSP